MKKFLHLQCTVCNRTIDQLVDNTHVASDRCTITLRCAGHLVPVVYRNNALIAPQPVVGVADWTSRHKVAETVAIKSASLITATSGPTTTTIDQRLVIAVRTTAPLTTASTAVLTLNKQVETTVATTQFVYRRDAAFSSIEGVESGIEKKTLSYNTTSQNIDVYFGGIKLTRNVDYWLAGDSATAIANAITFTSLISEPGITQVDVVVSPKVTVTPTTITLKRNKYDESRVGSGAWENVDFVDRFVGGTWQRYYLFTADIDSSADTLLTINSLYTAEPTVQISSYTSLDVLLLLAHAPYSSIDRYTTVAAPLANITGSSYLKYSVISGGKVLQLVDSAVVNIYPPLRLSKFTVDPTLTTSTGVSDLITIDGSVILGPDA
jgi:hypothetical protein